MRMTAPVIGGAAVVLAVALVWYFRPDPEPPGVLDDEAASLPGPVATAPAAPRADTETPPNTPSPADAPVAEAGARPAAVARSPLPGETPSTPMANVLTDREQGPRRRWSRAEPEFTAEPVDSTWAPVAEADLLAEIAQIPGLELIAMRVECRSTMCLLQLTRPGVDPADGSSRPFDLLLDSVGPELRWVAEVNDRSSARSRVYLWREGFAPEQAADQPPETD